MTWAKHEADLMGHCGLNWMSLFMGHMGLCLVYIRFFLDFDTVALSFLFDKHCPIMK